MSTLRRSLFRIRGRLIIAFFACGLIPVILVSGVNYVTAQRGNEELGRNAVKDLGESTEEQLRSIRDLKTQEIEDYLHLIRDQIITMSDSPGVVEATKIFKQAFVDIPNERQLDSGDVDRMRADLVTFYRDEFGAKYLAENEGKDHDALARLASLSPREIALQHSYVFANPGALGEKHHLDSADDQTTYSRIHKRFHPSIRNFLERFGYYDIFIVDDQSGHIVYSVFKELDFATSLLDGPYRDTNFARAFEKALTLDNAGEVVLEDFECYYPSYEAPASFIASPIFDGDKRVGVLMFQMPVDRLKELIAREAGLGESGQTLVLGSNGRLRCDPKRGGEEFTLANTYLRGGDDKLHSGAIRQALAGKRGIEESKNFLGETVLAAYGPIKVLGLHWAISTEINRDEAYASANSLVAMASSVQAKCLWTAVTCSVLAAIAIGLVGFFFTRSIVNPIDSTVATLQDIAEGEGDLTRRLDENLTGELGDLSRNFNRFVTRIAEIIDSISDGATTLGSASNQLSESARSLADGANETKRKSENVTTAAGELSGNIGSMSKSTAEMSAGMTTVSRAIEGMKRTMAEIAKNAERSAAVASEASEAAEKSNIKISNMDGAADEIGRVIEVIEDIAEQTNLLALNATIEAARAGEAGKGFAVVATEVKELAKQTATATEDIRSRIEAMQGSTNEAVDSIAQISSVIAVVNELSAAIAGAVEKQRATTNDIAGHIGSSAELAQSVARGVAESATASQEINNNMAAVDDVLESTVTNADQSRSSGEELLRLADEMRSLVGQFRTTGHCKELFGQ
ncbi:MAG: methyl-accepting chemotaxis protein [Planctomycetota bacterium]